MPDVRPALAAPPRASAPSTKAAIGGGLGGAALVALTLAVAALKPDEGKVNTTYLDIAKVPTYCYGHADRTSKVGTPHSDAQCDALLNSDARRELEAVKACVPQLAERPYQLAAATRLAHNIGPTAFCNSGTASAFRRGDWRKGCDLMLAWDKARVKGRLVQVPGLAARRQRERAMCLTGLPA